LKSFLTGPLAQLIIISPRNELCSFFYRCVKEEWTSIFNTNSHKIIGSVLRIAINLCKCEIESNEISVGIIIAPQWEIQGEKKDNILINALAENFTGDDISEFKNTDWATSSEATAENEMYINLRRLIRHRDKIIGLATGYYEQPAFVFGVSPSSELKLMKIAIVRTPLDIYNKSVPSPHEFYKYITGQIQNSVAIWIKPTGSIRIYGSGNFMGNIMKLRDATGWAVHNVKDLVFYIKSRAPSTFNFFKNNDIEIERCILYPCISLSEEKKGGSIYFLHKADWNNLSKNAVHTISKAVKITELKVPEIYCYLQQDGCVVVDEEGYLLSIGNYFEGAGGRKGTAQYIAKKAKDKNLNMAALVVSQDGGIYFYSTCIPPEEEASSNLVRLDFFEESCKF